MSRQALTLLFLLFFLLPRLLLSASASPDDAADDTPVDSTTNSCSPPSLVVLTLDPQQARAVVQWADGSLQVVRGGQMLAVGDLPEPSFAVHQVTADKLVLYPIDDSGRQEDSQIWMQPRDGLGSATVRCLEIPRDTADHQMPSLLTTLEVVNREGGTRRQLSPPSTPPPSENN